MKFYKKYASCKTKYMQVDKIEFIRHLTKKQFASSEGTHAPQVVRGAERRARVGVVGALTAAATTTKSTESPHEEAAQMGVLEDQNLAVHSAEGTGRCGILIHIQLCTRLREQPDVGF